jgi:hypothetical protein
MKKILTTFAGCSYALKMSQDRLTEQAKKYFNGCANFDENTPQIIQLFRQYPKVSQYRRGVGFWFWKPFIILKTLENVNDGDFVFYIDSGTDIVGDITPLFDICQNNKGFLLFENRSGNPQGQIWQNFMWTKKDTFVLMNCDTENYHYGPQIDAAFQLYQKTPETLQFVKEYFQYCTDPRIVTDEPSTLGQNFSQFVDHRHDQSVASLLAQKYNIKLYPEPSEAGDGLRPSDCPYQRVFLHHRGTIYGRR